MPNQTALPAPFESSIQTVKREWLDYNGHLNMAYYNVLFDTALDETFTRLGLGPDYVASRNASYFTAEVHVCYLRELKEGDPVRTTVRVLGFDDKRVHIYQELYHAEEGFLSATSEQMALHVDMSARKVAPWPVDIAGRLAETHRIHAQLGQPAQSGRRIALPTG